MEMNAMLARWFNPIKQRVANMIVRALVENVNDGTNIRLLQLSGLAGETFSKVEHLQPGGISHVPVVGDEALLVSVNGDKSEAIAIVVDSGENRPTGEAGGNTVVWDNFGNIIRLSDGKIEIICSSGDVDINAKNVNVNLESGGKMSVAGTHLTVDA